VRTLVLYWRFGSQSGGRYDGYAGHYRSSRYFRREGFWHHVDPRLTRRSIAAIAHGCGFGDISGFNRTFKAAYGINPSDLRRGTPPEHVRRPAMPEHQA